MSRRAATPPPRDYPVGIPVKPPPNWRPPGPRRPAASPFRAQMTIVLRTLLLSLLVIVCMGIGWFLVNGRRPARPAGGAVARSDLAKRDDSSPKSTGPEKPAPPPEEKKQQPAPAEDPKAVPTYEKDVLPIMKRACVSCHAGAKKKGGLDLATLSALVRGGDGGPGVVPGKPDDSPLYDTVVSGRMPPGPKKLSPGERETIRAWIASGARGER